MMKTQFLALLAGTALALGMGVAQAEMKSDKPMDGKTMKTDKAMGEKKTDGMKSAPMMDDKKAGTMKSDGMKSDKMMDGKK